jgi:hypothetical protein
MELPSCRPTSRPCASRAINAYVAGVGCASPGRAADYTENHGLEPEPVDIGPEVWNTLVAALGLHSLIPVTDRLFRTAEIIQAPGEDE